MAVFSKRVSTRRLSLSQPMSRSTMLRSRYASRSNSTGLRLESWPALLGMTGSTPRSRSQWSIQSARYALSPASLAGYAKGSSAKSSQSTSSSNAGSSCDSWVCPGESRTPSGWPRRSQTTWIFVEKPPRERPNACSAGSSGSPFYHRLPHSGRPGRACRPRTRGPRQSHPRQHEPQRADAAPHRASRRWPRY